MEKTLVLIKPDAIEKNIVGRVIAMYEENGLLINQLYSKHCDDHILSKHYEEHIHRDFYPSLVDFMKESQVIVISIVGENAVEKVRALNGATNPQKSRPGTIRFIYGDSVQRNVVHGSASIEEAKRELEIWFGPE